MSWADDPVALVEISVELVSPSGAAELARALQTAAAQDGSFEFRIGPAGEIMVGARTEADLDRVIGYLGRSVELRAGAPQVAYRETLTRRATVDYTHKRVRGGVGQFARVKFVFEPNGYNKGFDFITDMAPENVAEEDLSEIRKGLHSALGAGVLAGFPVVDVRAVLIDWAWHETDSRPPAFEIASRAAFREGLEKGRSVLLEPVMKVDVRAPEACAEPIIRDLQARRGVVESPGAQRPRTAILARAPLANLFGFAHRVRSLTRGVGGFTMRYDRYAPVSEDGPPDDFRPAMALRA
ncbi:MAG: hypothetical protein JO163_11580 [Methylobacteriaceae bacterium]|nr:hypothetical protein [Methylobacteriaceae bacterium]MBV9703361.1 hypothetical protein [Methylobacteriaceae bacterium]